MTLKDEGGIWVSIFDEIKERVTAYDVVTYYGIIVDSKGMCRCPFHNDRNPSMKVDKRYHCFGCGADGDATDFVANYFGLSVIEAAKKLNEDMKLQLRIGCDKRLFPKSQEQIMQEKEQAWKKDVIRAFNILRRDAINILTKYHKLLWEWKREYGPEAMNEGDANWHPFFVEALGKLEHVNELLDDLSFGDRTKQLDVLETYGEEIRRIGERIKQFD
ncbi:CHC2 zinc finger domain-containing protein [Butyrivibrio proteoclasticus]|uniref:CHC2 zinc finger domain-containing protein n=1 Tax=Butyrivibrio proteoclasticus TaxID=43305 RepID=UPI000688F9D3|nr:CHC2 zinc finger domain-containing protein [Butyrivibrio proteoclasticus]